MPKRVLTRFVMIRETELRNEPRQAPNAVRIPLVRLGRSDVLRAGTQRVVMRIQMTVHRYPVSELEQKTLDDRYARGIRFDELRRQAIGKAEIRLDPSLDANSVRSRHIWIPNVDEFFLVQRRIHLNRNTHAIESSKQPLHREAFQHGDTPLIRDVRAPAVVSKMQCLIGRKVHVSAEYAV